MSAPLRQTTATRASAGQAHAGSFEGPELKLTGYWLPESGAANVEIPIFQHAFYPKLTHTDLDIRQNVTYRQVKIPDMHTLRKNGITAERAFFVQEVLVHPRHIKNHNYFRADFPATVKSLSRRENVVFIFPSNDIPSARLKRKSVLNLYRQVFTPLLLDGKQHVSGRMGFYMAAPSEVVRALRSHLRLNEEEKITLNEWYPTRTRTRTSVRGKGFLSERDLIEIGTEVVRETHQGMEKVVYPLVKDKLDVRPRSSEDEALKDLFSSPELTQDLLKKTKSGTSKSAINRWVKEVLIPRMREALGSEAEQMIDRVTRFTFNILVSAAIDSIIKPPKGKPGFGQKYLQNVAFTTSGVGTTLGHTNVRYSRRLPQERLSTVQDYLSAVYTQTFGESSDLLLDVVDIQITGTHVKISINPPKINQLRDFRVEGKITDPQFVAYLDRIFLPRMSREITSKLSSGELDNAQTGSFY